MGHHITLVYLPSDFRVAYAGNISERLTIRWEIDHHTGNYVPCSIFSNSVWVLLRSTESIRMKS